MSKPILFPGSLRLVISLAIWSGVQQVTASTIQYRITGTIDVQFQVGPLPPGIAQDAPFDAILTYDLTTPDSRPDDAQRGIYATTGVESNFLLVRIGTSVIRSNAPLTLDVGNDRDIEDPPAIDGFPDDSFTVGAVPFEGNFEQPSISIMRLRLYNPTRLAFDSDALPMNLKLADFVDPFSLDEPFIEISTLELDSRVHQFTLHAVMESITVVPEPSTIALVAVATVLLVRSQYLSLSC